MTIKSSGSLALTEIQAEFGGSSPISLSEYYRNGAYVTSNNTGVPTSGQISFNQFYSTVKQFIFTISSHVQQADLRTLALAAGWNGTAPIVATINSGIYLWSDNTGVGGLTVSNIPTGSIINNYGYIIGRGGNGGSYSAGQAGGPALVNSVSGITVNNLSGAYIAGGGGGGGGSTSGDGVGGGGGGAGGGYGGAGQYGLAGGAGGAIGQAGANGQDGGNNANGKGGGAGGGGGGGYASYSNTGGGGGGGRILTGTGGAGGNYAGGAGGSYGNVGGNETTTNPDYRAGAGGGGWGAAGGSTNASYAGTAGGAGGKSIQGISGITLNNSGTIYGATA